MEPVGILSTGIYLPHSFETGEDVAVASGIPLEVVQQKMGIIRKGKAAEHETISYMSAQACLQALEKASVDPKDVDLVISHGSEYKDHAVWTAAVKIQHEIGAVNGYAFEMYALCAGAAIAYKTARDLMRSDDRLRHVLVTAASRESDLISYQNPRARFMYNFGAGGGAMLLRRGERRNQLLEAAFRTDGSLSETVVLTRADDANGAIRGDFHGNLDVTDMEYMSARLGEVSMNNFKIVIQEAVERSGYNLSDLKFAAITHMKRSAFDEILASIGLTPEQSIYLDHYGHVQSVDQVLALQEAQERGMLQDGALIVLAGAGTGYTWSAIAVKWGT